MGLVASREALRAYAALVFLMGVLSLALLGETVSYYFDASPQLPDLQLRVLAGCVLVNLTFQDKRIEQ